MAILTMLAWSWLASTYGTLSAYAQNSNVTLSVTLSSNNITINDPLSVVLNLTSADSGNFTVSSGAFSSLPINSTTGFANITIPPGVLQIGNTALNASFAPSSDGSVITSSVTVAVTSFVAPAFSVYRNTNLTVQGDPFAALPYNGGLLVSVTGGGENGTGIAVFTGQNQSALTFQCLQKVGGNMTVSPLGLAKVPNGLGLVVAIDTGIALLDYQAVVANCSSSSVIIPQGQGAGSFDVAVAPDDKFVAVANEYGVVSHDSNGTAIEGNVGIVELFYDPSTGVPINGTTVARIATGATAIPGVTISHDGSRIYVTSEIADPGTNASGTSNPILDHGVVCQQGPGQNMTYGLLTVIDVATALSDTGENAVLATVAAGCSPVRAVETTDGEVLWVAARGDNRVLAFSVGGLLQDPDNALIGYADVGIAPVGIQLFALENLLAVADSNRFANNEPGSITIVNARPVAATIVQTLPGYMFPRQVSVGNDDFSLYITDFSSGVVQILETSVTPSQ